MRIYGGQNTIMLDYFNTSSLYKLYLNKGKFLKAFNLQVLRLSMEPPKKITIQNVLCPKNPPFSKGQNAPSSSVSKPPPTIQQIFSKNTIKK